MSSIVVFERNGFKVELRKGVVAGGFDAYILTGPDYRRQYIGNEEGKRKAIAACKRKIARFNRNRCA